MLWATWDTPFSARAFLEAKNTEGSCTLQLRISPCRTWCSQPHPTCLASSFRSGRRPGLKCSPFGWCWDLELNTDVSNMRSFGCNYFCRRMRSDLEHTHPALNCYLPKSRELKRASKNCCCWCFIPRLHPANSTAVLRSWYDLRLFYSCESWSVSELFMETNPVWSNCLSFTWWPEIG